MRKLSLFFWQLLAACLVAMLIAQHIAINALTEKLSAIMAIAAEQKGWVYFDLREDAGGCK